MDSNVFDTVDHRHNLYFAMKYFLKSPGFHRRIGGYDLGGIIPPLIRFRFVLQCYSIALYTELYLLRKKYIRI